MAWNEWIAKHAKLVLAIWIVIIIASVPLAIKLNEVTNYGMSQMMPKHIESIDVQNIMTQDFEKAQNENTTYLIITNISVNDEKSKEAYYAFKHQVEGKYAYNVTSYYDILDMLWNTSYDIALNVTKMTANVSGLLYNTAIKTNESYGKVLDQTFMLANTTENMKSGLVGTAKGYLALRANLTELYTQMMGLSKAINGTDKAYFELHKNLTQTGEMLRELNQTILETNIGLYSLNESYGNTFMGTLAVYKALLESGAYDMGYLSPQAAEAIAMQTGTKDEFVYAVFEATYPIYVRYGKAGITDPVLANVTSGIILSQINESQRTMAEAYSMAFYQAVLGVDKEYGNEYVLQSMPPEILRPTVSRLATSALHSLPQIIAMSNQSAEIPGFGVVDSKTMAALINASISLGKKPLPVQVEEAAVRFALEYMKAMQPDNPLLQMPNAEEILLGLMREGPTKSLERTLLITGLEEKLPEELQPMVPTIVDTTMEYDPYAVGILTWNSKLLENATIDITSKLMESKGLTLPEDVLRGVYSSGGDEKIISGIAKELLEKEMAEKLQGKVPDPEKVAKLLVDEATANPEGIINGSTLENATVTVVFKLMPPESRTPEAEKMIRALYNGANPKELAETTFLNASKEKLDEMMPSNTPKEVKDAVWSIIEEVVTKYPMTQSAVEGLVKEKVESIIGSYLEKGIGGVEINVNVTQLVDIAFNFKDDPEKISKSDVKPIAEQIYPTVYKTAGAYLKMFKSEDNTTMLVTFVPKGTTAPGQDQYKYLAGNATIVKDIALKEFGTYYPHVTAALGGTPIELHEMFTLGEKDNERTTRASIIGALVILFILMGAALLATFLPFTGVATATLTALGITYLLAKGNITDVGSWARMITITTALGLGIDYSTYYLHRFKEYLAEGYEHEKAVAEALKRSKDAVLASAFTDIIAFASFMLAWEFPMFQQMGIIAPLAVVTVLVASLTFIPAITALVGDKAVFWWPRHIKHVSPDVHEKSKIAGWVVKHAKIVLLIGLLIAVPATYNFFHFNGSHDMTLFLPENSETYHFLQLSQEKLGAAVASPYYIVLEFNGPITDSDLSTIQEISSHLEKMNGVTGVYSPTMPYGEPINNLSLETIKNLGGDRYISTDGSKVLIQVSGKYNSDSDAAKELVKEMRAYLRSVSAKNPRLKAGLVGGNAALSLDLSNKINDVFWHRILPVALILMFLSLIPTLKGLPAVASTMATIFLGVMTSIWASTWLFEKIFGQQVMWFLPLMVFVVLMGVGIDYNSFYLVKARDEFERRSPRDALVVAAGTMDTLVIGLAAVLATTYGSLMLSGTWGTREMGFALAAGVLLTATMAVYFIGPAMMSLFGKKAWWPLFKEKREG